MWRGRDSIPYNKARALAQQLFPFDVHHTVPLVLMTWKCPVNTAGISCDQVILHRVATTHPSDNRTA
jgi:hypothetical protein